ncbi:MAG: YfhO family protein [Bacteroidota bacterium]
MDFKKILPYLIAILTFVVISLAYFSPVLDGKELFQSDIAQFRGMSKEIRDFREANNEEPYWTDRAFGGMPAYQLSAYYPHDYLKKLDNLLRFLPRPADYLFLYFLGFFVLLLVLKVDWKQAIIGSLAFGFSTYLIIIIGVGHNAKAHAIAYMPMVLAGILLVFQRKKYLAGFILTALSMALEINAGHPQMTYYLLFMVLIFGVVYLIDAIKDRHVVDFVKNIGILFVAVVLAVGLNATSLMATKEYAAHSTRSKSELTIAPNGQKAEQTTGLSKDYITQYSYGILETFDLFIPRFMGGSNNEDIGKDSNTYDFVKDVAGPKQAKGFAENAPMYWGDQPIVAAPAYIGAVVIFLFVLGVFLIRGKLKKWLVAATIFSILLSWGKNFGFLTDLFIDYVPLYNKFRAVSSIQVIAELAVPILGILGLKAFFDKEISKEEKVKSLKYSVIITGGLALIFTVAGTSLFAFESINDTRFENMAPGFAEVLIADRKDIFFNDSLRALILVVLAASLLWFYLKEKINVNLLYAAFGILILVDMVAVDKRYVNNEDFITKSKLEKPFPKTEVDTQILKDRGHYRVMNFMVNPMNDGSTSFYHNSIGGYHAAKPRRYQELFDFQIAKNNIEVLNMLNTKYFIFPDENNRPTVQLNDEANGNAWFVDNVKFVNSADEEIKALDSLNTKEIAVVSNEFKDELKGFTFQKDSTATINLIEYKANKLVYESNSTTDQIAIFSEMYYKDGWNTFVDGKFTPHFRANYVLRATIIPKGKHKIEFKFEPEVIQAGSYITLISLGLIFFITLGWYFLENRKHGNTSQ